MVAEREISYHDFRWLSVVQVVLDCLGVTGEASAIKESARRQTMPERTEKSDMVMRMRSGKRMNE